MSMPAAMPDDELRHMLSALCDGEVASSDAQRACAHWRASTEARADWHLWALIGDAMRAESLCASARHDAAFVLRLRERLAREPVVLAPAPPAARGAAARAPAGRWANAGAMAAGLAVVAGAVVMLRTQAPTGEAALLAAGTPASAPAATGAQGANPALAGYLYAHRQYAPTAMPGGVRPVSLQPNRP